MVNLTVTGSNQNWQEEMVGGMKVFWQNVTCDVLQMSHYFM